MHILILCALPQEYAPLKRVLPSFRSVAKTPFPTYSIELPGKKILLLETGMDVGHARGAFAAATVDFSPELIVFAGFAGGLHPELGVGAVCVVDRVRDMVSGEEYEFSLGGRVSDLLSGEGVRKVFALTISDPERKRSLSARAGGRLAVMDMETSAVAEEAMRSGISCLCLRAISDGVNDDLGFNVGDITDGAGRVSIRKVLRMVVQKPATVRALYQSWVRSRAAAMSLCSVLCSLLQMPAGRLGEMTREIRVRRAGELVE
ncbi:MAG: hypothetical protein LLG06_07250 [Desulfobacteraceae bacterium]|nr:hypothetical protein [Desulfobacteraceae bacterium]